MNIAKYCDRRSKAVKKSGRLSCAMSLQYRRLLMHIVISLDLTQNSAFLKRYELHSLRLKSLYNLLSLVTLPLIKRSALENVLDKLNACKMDSNSLGDRLLRFVKRGELASAVDKCGADTTQSLEDFRVCVHRFVRLNSNQS
jgi:hypothetical protein